MDLGKEDEMNAPTLSALLVTADNGIATAWITIVVDGHKYQLRLNSSIIDDYSIIRTIRDARFDLVED
jgi:hypothetical protein